MTQQDNSKISWSGPMKQWYDATKFKLTNFECFCIVIWHHNIFEYLSFFDIYNLRFVSKKFNELIMGYKQYLRHFHLAKKIVDTNKLYDCFIENFNLLNDRLKWKLGDVMRIKNSVRTLSDTLGIIKVPVWYFECAVAFTSLWKVPKCCK